MKDIKLKDVKLGEKYIGDVVFHKSDLLDGKLVTMKQIEQIMNDHGIWILVNITIDNKWYFELFNLREKRNAEIYVAENISHHHDSPQAAYSAAINHILKEL